MAIDYWSRRPLASNQIRALDEVCVQQEHIFALIHRYNGLTGADSLRSALLETLEQLVGAVAANFTAQAMLIAEVAPRDYPTQIRLHQHLLADLRHQRDVLRLGTKVSELELAHGLDGLLVYYLTDDLFIERTASASARSPLKHWLTPIA